VNPFPVILDDPPHIRRALTVLDAVDPTQLGSFTGVAQAVGAPDVDVRRVRRSDAAHLVGEGLARFTFGGVVLSEAGVAARKLIGPLQRRALLSSDGRYRYVLEREWDPEGRSVCWVMLNPSTADADMDDPTIRKCLRFTKHWAASDPEFRIRGMTVVNLFARRSTSPQALLDLTLEEMSGPDNAQHLQEQIQRASFVVAGWGGFYRKLAGRPLVEEIAGGAEVPLFCLGTTASGDPRHPLYVPGDTNRQPWP
jgi:hypothetical protein